MGTGMYIFIGVVFVIGIIAVFFFDVDSFSGKLSPIIEQKEEEREHEEEREEEREREHAEERERAEEREHDKK